MVAAKNYRRVALEKITDNVDVAIMDMKLGSDGQAGCTVISKMNELSLRIPTVVYTATPDEVEEKDILKVFKKGASTYEDIFNYLSQVYKTGITDILGHKGFFESKINEYYENIFLQQKDVWMDRLTTATSEDVKKSLLRTVIYHLEQLLEASTGKTFFEEFYLNCCDSEIHTGSLLKKKNEDIFYVIMSPACDLVEREDKKGNLKRNIDTITLCEIEPIERYGYTLKAEGDDKTLGNDKKKQHLDNIKK
jgi:CheY-like chemotaxis protein